MPMRRPSETPRSTGLVVSLREFGWDAAWTATLEHSTLPWFESFDVRASVAAKPLPGFSLGERDALSILGQYAAHLAFLRFSGVRGDRFDASDWGVVRKRGCDARLVRLRAAACSGEDDTGWVELVEQMGQHLAVRKVKTLGQAWHKPEAVYVEIEKRLRVAARSDLRWLHRSAVGWVRSPDAEGLQALISSDVVMRYDDIEVVDTVKRFLALSGRESILFDGCEASPLRPRSALPGLPETSRDDGSAGPLIEAFLAHTASTKATVIVRHPERFDRDSLAVVRALASEGGDTSWVVPESFHEPASSRHGLIRPEPGRAFVLSSSLDAMRRASDAIEDLPVEDRRHWLDSFTAKESLPTFLDEGLVTRAGPGVEEIGEPRRSYLAALALAGEAVPVDVARAVLDELGCQLDLDDILADGIAAECDGAVCFATPWVRGDLIGSVPAESRNVVLRIAAAAWESAGGIGEAMRLLLHAGESEEAWRLIQLLDDESFLRQILADVPTETVRAHPMIAKIRASHLIDEGQYEDARELLETVEKDDRGLLSARIERRLGNYALALEHLRDADEPVFAGEILAAEIHRLMGSLVEANEHLSSAEDLAKTPNDRERLGYERAMLAIDQSQLPDGGWKRKRGGDRYLEARFDSYLAGEEDRHEDAIRHAQAAVDEAGTLGDRIDAALDVVYARFLSGDWTGARHAARTALTLAEETQGDRAAGGILFDFAWLCADAGQLDRAENLTNRLKRFYHERCDVKREGEVDLLRAQIALGRFDEREAARAVARLEGAELAGDLRFAANLIRDELDWMAGALSRVRTTDETRCAELKDRHLLNVARSRGHCGDGPAGAFNRSLAEWEIAYLEGHARELPPVDGTGEAIRLMRSIVAMRRRKATKRFVDAAADLAMRWNLEVDLIDATIQPSPRTELDILRRVATVALPPEKDDLDGARWCFATRNRLGRWNRYGHDAGMSDENLDAILEAPEADWIRSGDNGLLFIDGLGTWSRESADAVAAIFHDRMRLHHRECADAAAALTIADGPGEPLPGVVGESAAMMQVVEKVLRVAGRDVPVCIEGESGTGKERIARALHGASSRRGHRFTAINCAALPENLIESELFGHSRGAFTGAERDRPGLIETTEGGTLFLDEIGEMPLPAQSKLLRFLQDGEFRRVGESTNRTADARIVTATNRRLEQAVDEGTFREDLLYRIRVVEIAIPPLRERSGDILLLARHFLAREHEQNRDGADRLSEEVEAIFTSYPWPGNVRELEHAIRSAHALAGEARVITIDHLPERFRSVAPVRKPTGSYYDQVNHFRKTTIERALRDAGGNQALAAKSLGMSRQALAYQIKELGILVEKR